jgi:hypothetical protein
VCAIGRITSTRRVRPGSCPRKESDKSVPMCGSVLTRRSRRLKLHVDLQGNPLDLLHVVRRVLPSTYCDTKGMASRPRAITSTIGAIAGWQDELAFAALSLSYRASGGMARGDDIGRMLADHGPGTFVSMAKLLEDEAIFGFGWNASLWIPMFQFELSDLSIKDEPARVRAELGEEFDGWTLAAWFVEPNMWLARRRPIDLLASDSDAVLLAARADRFVAAG